LSNEEVIPRELLPNEVILSPDNQKAYKKLYSEDDYPYVIYTYLKYIGSNCEMFLEANNSEEDGNFILNSVDDDSYSIGEFLTENLEIHSQMFKKALIETDEDDVYTSIHEVMEEQDLVKQLNSIQLLLEQSIMEYFELKFEENLESVENDNENNSKKDNDIENNKIIYSIDTLIKGFELFKDILNNLEIIKEIFKRTNVHETVETMEFTPENIDELIKNVNIIKKEVISENKKNKNKKNNKKNNKKSNKKNNTKQDKTQNKNSAQKTNFEQDELKVYILKVSFHRDENIYRTIKIRDDNSLEIFADKILKSLNFDDDHLYLFNLDNPGFRGENIYERAMGGEKSEKSLLKELELQENQEFYFLYDFGDEWLFNINVLKIENGLSYKTPRTIDSQGKLKQYLNENDLKRIMNQNPFIKKEKGNKPLECDRNQSKLSDFFK
jgi:hypothetical protein